MSLFSTLAGKEEHFIQSPKEIRESFIASLASSTHARNRSKKIHFSAIAEVG